MLVDNIKYAMCNDYLSIINKDAKKKNYGCGDNVLINDYSNESSYCIYANILKNQLKKYLGTYEKQIILLLSFQQNIHTILTTKDMFMNICWRICRTIFYIDTFKCKKN